MKKNIIIIIITLGIIFLSLTFINDYKLKKEMLSKYNKLEEMIIPTKEDGKIDFDSMGIEDHQHVAYALKAVARLGKNKEYVQELTQYLVEHADDNNDGEIGWGLGYAWSGFYADNPAGHVYAIEVANVIDAYIEALESRLLSKDLEEKVKNQLHDIVLIWNQKYWSENGSNGEKYFYWYSISKENAIGCINIDAKMVGSQARLLSQYGELFANEEKKLVYDHIDRCYEKIIQLGYTEDGYIKWDYLEKKESSTVNDAIHHGFILEGIYDYQKYRLKEKNPLENDNYLAFIVRCLDDNIIYRTPEHKAHNCFGTGAIRWIKDQDKQKEILLKSFDLYYNSSTNKRQLTFLLDAFSLYISQL